MNAGASRARAPRLWFLHADTRVRAAHLEQLAVEPSSWGHFRARLSGRHRLFRVIERLMNLRSRWTGIATGDQSLFVDAELFRAVGGFPDQPLMEDIELSRRLRARAGWPVQASPPVVTDSRRWEEYGAWRTMVRMWCLRWSYWRGADPARLQRLYERKGP
jgi:GT2 family glycosyltransferase